MPQEARPDQTRGRFTTSVGIRPNIVHPSWSPWGDSGNQRVWEGKGGLNLPCEFFVRQSRGLNTHTHTLKFLAPWDLQDWNCLSKSQELASSEISTKQTVHRFWWTRKIYIGWRDPLKTSSFQVRSWQAQRPCEFRCHKKPVSCLILGYFRRTMCVL